MKIVEQKRNNDYDFLRFIGIACVILAHMNIPVVLFQLRNLDVPLLVVLSGMSYQQFSSVSHASYGAYLKSRIIRLCVPVWLFTTFFITVNWLTTDVSYTPVTVALLYVFVGGAELGLWIIRIFVSMALLAPFLLKISLKLKSQIGFYLFVILAFGGYALLGAVLGGNWQTPVTWTYKVILLHTIAYALLYLYGIRLIQCKPRTLCLHMVAFLCLFLGCFFYYYHTRGVIVYTKAFKYPPRLYYLSYALFGTLLFYLLTISLRASWFERMKNFSLVRFVGSSPIWVYLWHWFFLRRWHLSRFSSLHYSIQFLCVFGCAVLTVWVQQKVVFYVCHKLIKTKSLNKQIRKIFVG